MKKRPTLKKEDPNPFGSRTSMVVSYIPCVCEDEFGEYVTETKRLDNGLGDPNRWSRHEST